MGRGLHPVARAALTDVRNLAVVLYLPRGLAGMLRRRLPAAVVYLNIGHSNLSKRILEAVRHVPQAWISVFVHDVISLEYPQYQREGTVEVFMQKMCRVRAYADLIIYNFANTQMRTERVMAEWGPVPQGIFAFLGTIPPVPNVAFLPQGLPPEGPYSVIVGTIEPRKTTHCCWMCGKNCGLMR